MVRRSKEEYEARKNKSKNKYGNIKTNGYDSKKESKRAYELKLLQMAGLISDLQEQVSFELQEKFVYCGEKIRAINYIADFVYQEDGKTVVEDVKGMKTDVYKLKKKLFLYKYPDYIFKET